MATPIPPRKSTSLTDATLSTAADQLVKSARQTEGRSISDALLDIARRQRVKILELEGQLAALEVTFTKRFGAKP